MKAVFLALSVILAGAVAAPNAAPKSEEARFIDGIIVGIIEEFAYNITARGLDPLDIERAATTYKLPVTDLLVVEASVEKLLVEGLSNIVVNNINFSILATRLRFDISMPSITAQIGSAQADVNLGGHEFSASASGRFGISMIRVVGDVRVNIGLDGISIRSMSIDFTVGGIQSALNIKLLGHEISDRVNTLLGETVPTFLIDNREDINTLIEHYLKEIIEDRLSQGSDE